MRKILFLLCALMIGYGIGGAQEVEKCEQHQLAEEAMAKGQMVTARYQFNKAFEKYADQGQMKQATECATRATALYCKENCWREAFDLLRRTDQTITSKVQSAAQADALHYLVSKERMQMYVRLRKPASAQEQLNIMERQANASGDEEVKNDLLYNKAIYYYSSGQNEKGNAAFSEMAEKLTASADYDKVDEAYQTLIASGRSSGNANMVAQSYSRYITWKDSVTALKNEAEVAALKDQIAKGEATIADKDSSLSTRTGVITALSILAAALAAALILGAIVLLRFIAQNRKQKNTIRLANENIALKAKFINNIAAQLSPSLQKLDRKIPEVKALQDFSDHVQTLAALESSTDNDIEMEDIKVQPFCEEIMDEIRGKVKKDVELMVKAPKMNATVNKEYVSHILRHLLHNAAIYTPEGGHITLEFKKRSAKIQQFLVFNTGENIPEEKREDVFKPFLEIKDLAKGDGLGLPICKTMAQKMDGDLTIDPSFVKGTRFVLDLHA